MTVELLGQIFGIALSLGVFYVPQFKAWYDTLESPAKALFMLGFSAVYAFGAFGLACAGYVFYGLTCDVTSAMGILALLLKVAIANQATYFLVVRPNKPE